MLYPVTIEESDTKGMAEEPYINKALSIGWMRNFPDGRFYPDDKIQRSHFALILYRVSKSLPLFPSKTPREIEIGDVGKDDYLYPAVLFATSNGFLKMEDHAFGKERTVSGYEAARAFSSFRTMLKK